MINDMVYAEISIGFAQQSDLDESLEATGIELVPIARGALFRAGKTFQAYRRNAGTRETILPDFIIGAHAVTLSIPLITRDRCRFRTYFPELHIVSP